MRFYLFISIATLAIFFLIQNLWKKRHFYYCAWKVPGPLSVPFVGTISLITAGQKEFYSTFIRICQQYKPIFRFWIGNYFCVVNADPEDVEILLSTCFEKKAFSYILSDLFSNEITLLTAAPSDVWKNRRKEYSRCFNPKILNTFHDSFVKYSKKLVEIFAKSSGEIQTDLVEDIWKVNLDSFIESMGDIDPTLFTNRYDIIKVLLRAEEIFLEKFRKFWHLLDFIWRFSHLRKEMESAATEIRNIGKKLMILKKQQLTTEILEDELRMKRLSNLVARWKELTEEEKEIELVAMTIAGSETSSVYLITIFLVLGIFPKIQEKIYQEILSVLGTKNQDFSSLDINKMEYLERVIKETMRILPPVPLIIRSIDKDIKLKSYLQPEGSHLVIPIIQIHRNPDLWPDPLKFDPDRFLQSEDTNRHRCSFIPFSFGPRNCIGLKLAMMSMKVMVAYVVKNFTIKTLDCTSIEDIEMEFKMVLEPKNYRVIFEKRTKF